MAALISVYAAAWHAEESLDRPVAGATYSASQRGLTPAAADAPGIIMIPRASAAKDKNAPIQYRFIRLSLHEFVKLVTSST
jgi:hypothetical protein